MSLIMKKMIKMEEEEVVVDLGLMMMMMKITTMAMIKTEAMIKMEETVVIPNRRTMRIAQLPHEQPLPHLDRRNTNYRLVSPMREDNSLFPKPPGPISLTVKRPWCRLPIKCKDRLT